MRGAELVVDDEPDRIVDLDADQRGVRVVHRRPVAHDDKVPALLAQEAARPRERGELARHAVAGAEARLDEVADIAGDVERVPRGLAQVCVAVGLDRRPGAGDVEVDGEADRGVEGDHDAPEEKVQRGGHGREEEETPGSSVEANAHGGQARRPPREKKEEPLRC